ncbi:Uncharacterised protein [BD1-7 clade bacterium]|uniref:Uncharacterized protein n=1 Tax=BD1-7 clade bacterium TaxID=2029982 RepID=A0A5S9PUC0_9GAMM|nr:Uncharacterised protein [BD1-7 clade bacterium]
MNKTILSTAISTIALLSAQTYADQYIQDDQIVSGSLCVGTDCSNGENFGFDTIRLKENNVRIRAVDSSSSSSFPTIDWQLTFNDSANGGINKFSIDEIDSGRTPFTIVSSAPSHSIYVRDNGFVGFNTSAPVVNLHLKYGNSPSLRLEQDGSSGFTSQVWDVAGNETNFFIRDATNGSKIPFKIKPSAPNDSLFIAADGDIGFETSTPDGILDIAHPADANNHAVLISPVGYFGINIDNGKMPAGLLDVQTTGGKSHLTVTPAGKVGINTSAPVNMVEVKSTDGTQTRFSVADGGAISTGNNSSGTPRLTVAADGKVGIGTSAPSANLEVAGTDGATNLKITDKSSGLILSGDNVTALRVENTATETTRLLVAIENNGPTGIAIKDSSADGIEWFILNTPGGLKFFANGTQVMRLNSDGSLDLKGAVNPNSL